MITKRNGSMCHYRMHGGDCQFDLIPFEIPHTRLQDERRRKHLEKKGEGVFPHQLRFDSTLSLTRSLFGVVEF